MMQYNLFFIITLLMSLMPRALSFQNVLMMKAPATGCFTTWTPRDSNRTWVSVASSSDGVKLVAVEYNGYLYTSTDSGATWTARTAAGSKLWTAVTSSSDGVKIVGVAGNFGTGAQIRVSTDSGSTWNDRGGYNEWYAVIASADGTKLVAVGYVSDGMGGGDTYGFTSSNSGTSWTQNASPTYFTGEGHLGMSSDGTKVVGGQYEDRLVRSTNSGSSWGEIGVSELNWKGVASSSDGVKLAAVAEGDKIYTSTNSGSTWTARDSNREWSAIASSTDGVMLAAAARNNAYIYTSDDSGVTWVPRTGSGLRDWSSIASSSDGKKLVATDRDGKIYTSTCP